MRTLAVLGIVAAVAVVGFAIQSDRSSGAVVTPKHALGPGGSEVLGRADAPVLVEEYADFQCPACHRFQAEVFPAVQRLIDQGKIRFAFHQFAFLGPESLAAANASECAGDQGAFWAFHDVVYGVTFPENSGYLSTAKLLAIGSQVGVDGGAFGSCVRDGTYLGWIRQVTDQGSQRGVSSTPAVFVAGTYLPNPTAAALEAAVQHAAG